MGAGTDEIRVLYVDDRDSADLAVTRLERADDRLSVRPVGTPGAALDALADDSDAVDCVVSEHDLPEGSGIDLPRSVRERRPGLPFVLFTGEGSEAIASEAISAGVTDYIRKEGGNDQYEILANRIANAVEDSRSRAALTEQNRELRSYERMINTMHEAACIYDEEGRFRMVNQYLADWYGTNREALRGELSELVPYIRSNSEGDPYQELLDGERDELRGEVEADFPEHGRAIVEYRLTPLSIDGTVEGVVAVARDVTEHREREQELVRVRDLLDETERIAEVGGWELDAETKRLSWTDHLSELLDIGPDGNPSLSEVLDALHAEDRPEVERAIERALESGEPFDVETRTASDDGRRWLQIHGEPKTVDGTVSTVRGAVHDVTEYRRRERELEQARAEYEELFNGMNDAAWVIDTDANFLAVNDAAVERTGYSREELLSMRPHDIDAGTDPQEITRLIETMPEDGVQVFETVRETRDGETIPVEISSSLITYEGETAILSVSRDISDRKRRERQLEEFASVVSHDLRNPLNVAEGRLELAIGECDSDHLERVADAHDRMQTLIEDLLSMARSNQPVTDRSSVDLAAALDRSWRNVRTDAAALDARTDRVVRADRSRLQQLLENLIRNAVEHGGEDVTVTVGDLEDGFYVEDDGPGIPADRREKVFETGFSTASEGVGFGLSIVAQVVEAHDWTIEVTEGERGGARFEITGVEFAE
ncbi:MAG: PAS domain S-box protein [Halobellus sp.]